MVIHPTKHNVHDNNFYFKPTNDEKAIKYHQPVSITPTAFLCGLGIGVDNRQQRHRNRPGTAGFTGFIHYVARS